MGIHVAINLKSWAIFLLLIGTARAQSSKKYFEWLPVKATRHTSSLPYIDQDTTTTGYDSRYYDVSAPYGGGTTGFYPDSSVPYNDGPYSDDSYSADFQKSQPYQYPPDSSGSYENYGYKDDNFNITIEKYGGFGGTGDTRGFGAYDYPKKVQDVPQDLGHHHEDSDLRTHFPDLLRIGRSKVYHRRNPMHVHPLAPPL